MPDLFEPLRVKAWELPNRLVMAPLTPFVTERVWQDLVRPTTPGAPDSVHLADWPDSATTAVDLELAQQMALVRRLVELGRAARASSGVKTRQPLGRALVEEQRQEWQERLTNNPVSIEELPHWLRAMCEMFKPQAQKERRCATALKRLERSDTNKSGEADLRAEPLVTVAGGMPRERRP